MLTVGSIKDSEVWVCLLFGEVVVQVGLIIGEFGELLVEDFDDIKGIERGSWRNIFFVGFGSIEGKARHVRVRGGKVR